MHSRSVFSAGGIVPAALLIVLLSSCANGDVGHSPPPCDDGSDGAAVAARQVPAGAAVSTQASTQDVRRMVAQEAIRNGAVPPALALAVARVGSGFSVRALGVSGATGTLQAPSNLAGCGVDAPPEDLGEPLGGIRAGLACLANLRQRYAGDWELALAHYRGGAPDAAGGGFAPRDYARPYVRSVLRWWRLYRNDPVTAAWLRRMQGLPRFAPSLVAAPVAGWPERDPQYCDCPGRVGREWVGQEAAQRAGWERAGRGSLWRPVEGARFR